MFDKKEYKFHVALSFSEESSIIASDLYNFLTECGLNVYYYKRLPDLTKGLIEEKISYIYKNSDINCMIWSEAYSNKTMDAIVTTEINTMYERHIKGSDSEREKLFILLNDINLNKKLEISKKFDSITYHSLNDNGLFNTRDMIINRLIYSYSYIDPKDDILIYHPKQANFNRGSISLCKFKIDPDYKSDNRWKKWANIMVNLVYNEKENVNTLKVYLIPSGRVTPLFSHNKILETQPTSKNLKTKLSIKFAEENLNREFFGYLFYINIDEMEYPYLYCIQYDNYLNSMLQQK